MAEELGKSGLFIDDLYRLRVLDPTISNETNDLKDECGLFTEKLSVFKQTADQFITIAEQVAKQVELFKMRAITAQNNIKTMSKQREAEQQQLQTQIMEKTMELDRLKVEYQYLQRVESEQQEIINNFYRQQ